MQTDFKYLKVLVVDDDEHLANILKVVLAAFCVETIHVAHSYDDALEVMRDNPIDCIFVDYMMTPVSGIKLINHIRWSEDKAKAQLPVILCTVYTDYDKIVEARDAGVSEILAKPINPTSIFHKIVAAVDKARPFVDSAIYKGPDRRRRNVPWTGKVERRVAGNLAAEHMRTSVQPGGIINA